MNVMRIAMISGGRRGIGFAIASELQKRGFALSLGMRTPCALPAGLSGSNVLVCEYDALDKGAEQRWVDQTIAHFGRIDVLVNSAGILEEVTFDIGANVVDADDEVLSRLLDVNVKAPFRLIRSALPYLKLSGEGRVINLASLSGKRVLGVNVGYQMSKHAIVALSHAVRRAGWDNGVRATALCPGFVATDMTTGLGVMDAGHMTSVDDLAHLAATVIMLPNNASVAELTVNCRYESML